MNELIDLLPICCAFRKKNHFKIHCMHTEPSFLIAITLWHLYERPPESIISMIKLDLMVIIYYLEYLVLVVVINVGTPNFVHLYYLARKKVCKLLLAAVNPFTTYIVKQRMQCIVQD